MDTDFNKIQWIVSLLAALIVGGYELWSLIDRVDKLEHRSYVLGEKLKDDVLDLRYRVRDIEKFCCGDKLK